MDVWSYRGVSIDSDHYLVTVRLRARISNDKQVTGIRTIKHNVSILTSSEVAEQYRQQIEEKLNHIALTDLDNGEELWERCKTIIISVAEEVLGIMEPANKGTWFDDECHPATENKNKACRNTQQGYGTRNLIEEYKENRRREKTIHKRKKKEWMKVELENTGLLRKQHERRKFYKAINIARKQFKPRVHICRNEDGSLISNEQEILNRR